MQHCTITGTLAKTQRRMMQPESEEEVVSVQYVDNKFIFLMKKLLKKIWKFDRFFLFQKLTLNKTELSKLRLKRNRIIA